MVDQLKGQVRGLLFSVHPLLCLPQTIAETETKHTLLLAAQAGDCGDNFSPSARILLNCSVSNLLL